MSCYAFSSLLLSELIKDLEQARDGVTRDDENWAESMKTKYHQVIQKQPLVYLTEGEDVDARMYLTKCKKYGRDIADNISQFARDMEVANIRTFLNTKRDDQHGLDENASKDDFQQYLPKGDGAPTCFTEWYAVNKVWRLVLGLPETDLQDAAFGTPSCLLDPLPQAWEDKLDECMQITDASAILPVPKFFLPITRRDLNSVLNTSEYDTDLTGLVEGTITNQWFQILVSSREQLRPGTAEVILPDSVDLVATTPQELITRILPVNDRLELVLMPMIIKEQHHCILVVAFVKKRLIAIYDPLGRVSTDILEDTIFPWVEETHLDDMSKEAILDTERLKCARQSEDGAAGIFMLINGLFACSGIGFANKYSQEDALFLRRYIAAVICMGRLPPSVKLFPADDGGKKKDDEAERRLAQKLAQTHTNIAF